MVIPVRAFVDGRIETESDVLVEGRVRGVITIGGRLTVAAGGWCRANIRARSAAVAGEVIGDVLCTEEIDVRPGGRIVGDLRAPDISVDADAEVDGRIDLLPPEPVPVMAPRKPLTTRGSGPLRPRPPARSAHDGAAGATGPAGPHTAADEESDTVVRLRPARPTSS
jgi:cytoskeletal protein CcmA (bactofilin family)